MLHRGDGMIEMIPTLHQFSTYIPTMDFTIHRYLLATDPAVLYATGTLEDARRELSEVEGILGDRELGYIVVSHIESDECGGLQTYLDRYPGAVVLCSHLGARELPGYGFHGIIRAVSQGDRIQEGEVSLAFADYPSEVHLQDGIVCIEEGTGVLYSADMFLSFGDGRGKTEDVQWAEAVDRLREDRIPEDRLVALKEALLQMSPAIVAVGHGTCLRTR